MPELAVVTGAPFSGKGRFVRSEIARREQAGELGLIVVDYTALYSAFFPGVQSSFRDEAVSDSGAPRLAAHIYEAAVAAVVAREIRGYVTTNSPRAAVALADRLGGAPLFDVEVHMSVLADRAEDHMAELRRFVPRAMRSVAVGRCRRSIQTYINESPRLVGRARVVSRSSGSGFTVGGVRRPFDRALWERGLTPRGRSVLADLVAEGIEEPTPTQVMGRLLGAEGRQ